MSILYQNSCFGLISKLKNVAIIFSEYLFAYLYVFNYLFMN